MGMEIVIARTACEQILAHAAALEGEEVCGLLIGRGDMIEEACVTPNVAPDRQRRFEIDPAALLAAHRTARGSGHRVIGHYHSHPNGAATPSLRDAAMAVEDGAVWVIAAGGRLAAYVAAKRGALAGRFNPATLKVV